MTEEEWLVCTDPALMLWAVQDQTTDRKLRLLACAACRAVWVWLENPRCREAIDVAERMADGKAGAEELETSARRAYEATASARDGAVNTFQVNWRVFDATQPVARHAAISVLNKSGAKYRNSLIRECFGNPFRPVAFDPAWRTSTVVALAEGIYADRAFDRMPILADALQDAGCENNAILTHCRDTSLTHVRGCWALDLVLGKE
jgi:hypothetical protein